MITYINKENAKAYQLLFQKAADFLKDPNNQPANLGISDWENFSIGSLNEYFAYLETIVGLSQNNESKLSMFIRLPLDEEAFEINADTRSISIPSSFSRYGVGVQGDESAEIIYFTIDRFFDHQDLANLDIAIQWESKNPDFPVGFTPNFGKEIINVQDKNGEWRNKIIFGWPISGELTKVNGPIKFAVRFYKLNSDNSFSYSFATLPAEISINNTLNYTMVASETLPEVNHGAELINRIRSTGIYDENAEIPENPTITVQLYALESNDKIIDLPAEGDDGIELAIAAQPTTSGVINYLWNKYAYIDGAYSPKAGSLDNDDSVRKEFVEITSNIPVTDISYFYDDSEKLIEDISLLLEETGGYYVYDAENEGFKRLDADSYVKVFKPYSIATVHSVGKYFVTVSARAGANESITDSEIITIPGPEKPEISYAEGANITQNDETVHVVVDQNGIATLKVKAATGESLKTPEEVGSDPEVTLAYSWYKADNDEMVTDVLPGDMTISVMPGEALYTDDAERAEMAAYNQSHIKVVQNGNEISLYKTAPLQAFTSTNEYQAQTFGECEWVALAIDTKTDNIEGLTWRTGTLDSTDVAEAASVGLGAGYVIFWWKTDKVLEDVIQVGDTELTFRVVNIEPESSCVQEDGAFESTLKIQGLDTDNLDETFYAKVTASRNRESTSKDSYVYRITAAPEKPVLKYREIVGNDWVYVQKDYTTQSTSIPVSLRTRTGDYGKITFAADKPTQCDKLSYIWMKANIQTSNSADYYPDSDIPRMQVDINDALPDLFTDVSGDPDTPADGSASINLSVIDHYNMGEIVDADENGNMPSLQFNENTKVGDYYYCIVVNELNNHRVANVTPFFSVT